MNRPERPNPESDHDPDEALLHDFRGRLQLALSQQSAARAETRRLARELSVAHRLLRFYLGAWPKAVPVAQILENASPSLLTSPLIYHVDRCSRAGTQTEIAGWAFDLRPVGMHVGHTITLVLRHDRTAYAVRCRSVTRPDLAAHFARGSQAQSAGGAAGIEAAGFACEIADGALPAGAEWHVVLRLECGGEACEEFTDLTVRF